MTCVLYPPNDRLSMPKSSPDKPKGSGFNSCIFFIDN